ncbi:MAG: 4-hydroxy-tetrahydrodipicolinate reductase, partial [Deltaproteobacteria bacterium]
MIKAIVTGPAGRMGGRIIHMMEGVEGITLAGAFEQPDHPGVGK